MNAIPPLPEPEVLIRKVKADGHGGHHGGSWKVAYADFMTAMMAFFLLMWLLGATNNEQRKGIADYFAPPSRIQTEKSAGGTGLFGGHSLREEQGAASSPQQAKIQLSTRNPVDNGAHRPSGKPGEGLGAVEQKIRERLRSNPNLKGMDRMLRFTETPDGLRIELIDNADYSMFVAGTAAMDPRAADLMKVVAEVVKTVPNRIAIRGHTDAVPFSGRNGIANNWALSSSRAESTRQALAQDGVPSGRFARLEGVADTEPFITDDPFDPRNRRMSVTLLRD
jgi:chemotaxis protein MotB